MKGFEASLHLSPKRAPLIICGCKRIIAHFEVFVKVDNDRVFCYNVCMDYFAGIYGNQTAKDTLGRAAKTGTFAHAYILEGVPGSGRFSLARAALCTLAGNEQDADRIARGIAPDVSVISVPEGKSTITVDQIRTLRSEAYLAPHELPFKAFVIEDAHRMNEPAQNALLKLLEEPPAGVYFFLLCEPGSRLLPTVSSRAPTLHTERLAPESMDKALCALDARALRFKQDKPEEYAYLLSHCEGSIGRALAAIESGEQDILYGTVIGLLELLRGADKAALLLYEKQLPDKRENFCEFLLHLSEALRDILILKKGGEQTLFFRHAEEVGEYCFAFSERALSDKIQVCLDYTEQLEYNVNLRLARVRLLEALWG